MVSEGHKKLQEWRKSNKNVSSWVNKYNKVIMRVSTYVIHMTIITSSDEGNGTYVVIRLYVPLEVVKCKL